MVLSGLAQTAQTLGAAIVAAVLAAYMSRHGRRPGLTIGYLAGALGGGLCLLAGVDRSFPLLLVGMVSGAGHRHEPPEPVCRDRPRAPGPPRARPQHGCVGHDDRLGGPGPNLSGPGAVVAGWLHIPERTGPFVFTIVALVAASTVMGTGCGPPAAAGAVGPGGAGGRRGGGAGGGRPPVGDHPPHAVGPRGGRRDGSQPRRHGVGHGDDADPHGSRRREPRGHRPGHQRPHPRDVRVLTAGRHARRPGRQPARRGNRRPDPAHLPGPRRAVRAGREPGARRRAVPARPGLVVRVGWVVHAAVAATPAATGLESRGPST